MLKITYSKALIRGMTFLVWCAVAASSVYWGLKLAAPNQASVAALPPSLPTPDADVNAVARVLGASRVSSSTTLMDARLVLVGVLASQSQLGTALIAVEGKPPKPYRVDSVVEEGWVVQSVQPRSVTLRSNRNKSEVKVLEMPALSTLPIRP